MMRGRTVARDRGHAVERIELFERRIVQLGRLTGVSGTGADHRAADVLAHTEQAGDQMRAAGLAHEMEAFEIDTSA